jgi:hypothetical protein
MEDFKVIIDDVVYVPRHFNLPEDWLDIIVSNRKPGYILSDSIISKEIIEEAKNVKCVNDVRRLFQKLFSLNYQNIHQSKNQTEKESKKTPGESIVETMSRCKECKHFITAGAVGLCDKGSYYRPIGRKCELYEKHIEK